jgi:hemoglobin
VDFWETILLDNPVYKSNAMEKHFEINKLIPLKKKHFDAWLSLFNETLDEYFTGPVADLAKKRASAIASLMLMKMEGNKNNTSIL